MRMEFSLAKKGFHFHSSFHTAPSPIFFIFTHFKSFSFPLAHPTWALHKGRSGILESGLGGEQCWGLGRDRGDQSPVKMGRRSEREEGPCVQAGTECPGAVAGRPLRPAHSAAAQAACFQLPSAHSWLAG